jgi:hypothetical protein
LGEHGEEASRKITELEALRKQKEEAFKKLTEEKAKLEEMIQSRDELIVEMADMYGLNYMGEGAGIEDDNDDGGDVTTPPATVPRPVPTSPATASEVIIVEEKEDIVDMVFGTRGP